MLNKISSWWNRISEEGLRFPFVHSPTANKPSVTLMFVYLSFVLAFISLISAHFSLAVIPATAMCILFWSLSVVFYRIRKMDKAKFDLDDKSISIEGNNDDDE